jgi:hypothetical protein
MSELKLRPREEKTKPKSWPMACKPALRYMETDLKIGHYRSRPKSTVRSDCATGWVEAQASPHLSLLRRISK